jgi:hypothetical protein
VLLLLLCVLLLLLCVLLLLCGKYAVEYEYGARFISSLAYFLLEDGNQENNTTTVVRLNWLVC